MGRHSASGSDGTPEDGDDSEYVETDTGSWQRSHRRSDPARRGVSAGLLGAAAAVVVVVVAIGLWYYFDKHKAEGGVEAAGTCVHGKNSIAVIADPSISDRINSLADRFNKKNEVIGDYCFSVSVTASDAPAAIKGLVGTAPNEHKPALWIPGSSSSVARLNAAAKTKVVIDSRSLVSTPVLIATSPKLRQAIPANQGWADLPGLQSNPAALDAFGLPGWGSLRLALPTVGNGDAAALAAEAVAAASVKPGDSPELGAGAAATVTSAAPKPPLENIGDAMDALLKAADSPAGSVHAVVTTEQQLFARTRNNPDAKKVVAAWQPAGATPVADYPAVQLDGDWLTEEQRSAASQFAHFLDEPDQLKDLASDGFRAEGVDTPSSDVVSFAKIDKPLSLDEKARAALADGTASSGTTTIMLSSSPAADIRLSDITSAVASRVRSISPGSGVGLWVYDGKEGNTVVRVGAAADDVEGVPRSQSVADALNALQPTGNGAVAYTTLRALYQEAVGGFRPGQINSVLVIAGHSHTDQTLDGPGLIDTINKLKDPAKPVRVNVIDFGSDSDQQTWQGVAQATGGAYQNLPGANTPEFAAALARFLS